MTGRLITGPAQEQDVVVRFDGVITQRNISMSAAGTIVNDATAE
jgi:hypothetical protein